MREFELLANEEQICDMAREFSKIKVRNDIITHGCKPSHDSAKIMSENKAMNSPEKPSHDSAKITGENNKASYHEKPCHDDAKNMSETDKRSHQNNTCFDEGKISGESHSFKGEDGIIHESNEKYSKQFKLNAETDSAVEERMCDRKANKEKTVAVFKAYSLECDTMRALKRLYSISPPTFKASIAELIEHKKEIAKVIASEYMVITGKELECVGDKYYGKNFCAVLNEISLLQERLLGKLMQLDDCEALRKSTNREVIIATAINRMGVFCYYNR